MRIFQPFYEEHIDPDCYWIPRRTRIKGRAWRCRFDAKYQQQYGAILFRCKFCRQPADTSLGHKECLEDNQTVLNALASGFIGRHENVRFISR